MISDLNIHEDHVVASGDLGYVLSLRAFLIQSKLVNISIRDTPALDMKIAHLKQGLECNGHRSEYSAETEVCKFLYDLAVLVSVISVDDDNDTVDTDLGNRRKQQSFIRNYRVFGCNLLSVNIYLEASRNTGCFKIDRTIDIFFRKNSSCPIDTDFILIT